jgi:hypothetical protein
MLFCDRLPDAVWASAPREQRRRELAELLTDFAKSFPSLSYRLVLDASLINAQAVTTASDRHINVYGGLVFHPGIGTDSLVLTILHETGHHLSNGRRSQINRTIACECEADFWAITTGATLLAEQSGRTFRLTTALRELSALHSLDQTASYIAENANRWSCEWSIRRQALLTKTAPSGGCFNQP